MAEKQFKPEVLKDEEFGSDIPWLGPEKLDSNVSVRWITWWRPTTLTFILTSGNTWSQTFTWFWFTPSYVNVKTTFTAVTTPPAICDVTHSNWVTSWYRIYDGSSNDISTRIVSLADSWQTNLTRADFTAFITDWVEFDFIDTDLDIRMTITCYP